MARLRFKPLTECDTSFRRSSQTIAADFEGSLLVSRSPFPYYFLVALEAGGLPRALVLLLCTPILVFVHAVLSKEMAFHFLVFLAFAGLHVSAIERASRAVLPRFYADDVHPEGWHVFRAFGRRCVVTANPRVMVEHFARVHLGADVIIGSEIGTTMGGWATGFLVGKRKSDNLQIALGGDIPHVGIGCRESDYIFMSSCKEAYLVRQTRRCDPLPRSELLQPVIFHDGRLARRPTPLTAFLIFLWLPIGFVLSLIRIYGNLLLPVSVVSRTYKLMGINFVVRGTLPPSAVKDNRGVLLVCNHRTVLDPVLIGIALGCKVSCVTYSISKLTKLISPIKAVALCRKRDKDAAHIKRLLDEGGPVVVCPEGTTCREPFLLRFSALFAELSDHIVPIAVDTRQSLFHGSTAGGWKLLDPYFFFMNPRPGYVITFLEHFPRELTCSGGLLSPIEVANHVQRAIGIVLGFECTKLTRKDKYLLLTGTDGRVMFNGKKDRDA